MREWPYTASNRDKLRCTSPPTSRFPSALEMSLGLYPRDISWSLGNYNPIHPSSRQSTYTVFYRTKNGGWGGGEGVKETQWYTLGSFPICSYRPMIDSKEQDDQNHLSAGIGDDDEVNPKDGLYCREQCNTIHPCSATGLAPRGREGRGSQAASPS